MRLPGPLRAAVGLVASATDEAKHLPDRAVELPMLAVSTALQVSLRAQQRYAHFAARGDAVLNRRPVTEDPPPWATFDDPVSIEQLRRSTLDDSDGLSTESSRLLEDIFGVAEPDAEAVPADMITEGTDPHAATTDSVPDDTTVHAVPDDTTADPAATNEPPVRKAPSPRKAPAKAAPEKATAEKSTAEKSTAEKAMAEKATAEKATTEKAPAKKAPAKKSPAKSAPAKSGPANSAGKSVSKPRHTSPSAFDNAEDDD